MFHDLDDNRRHYDTVSTERKPLYYQRFDTQILQDNAIVADLLKLAFEELFPSKVGRLLDLGCGTGFYYPLLSQHAESIVGVDVSRPMLDEAENLIAEHQLSNCRVQECSALELDFEDQSMDVVHSWDFLHHVSDVPQTIHEISRVLKPGGRFVAIEPNWINPSIAWYHLRRRSEWRLFTQNQFTLPRKLAADFEVRVRYDNTIISFLNERTWWLWKAVDRFTSIWPFQRMSFRYVMDAKKR